MKTCQFHQYSISLPALVKREYSSSSWIHTRETKSQLKGPGPRKEDPGPQTCLPSCCLRWCREAVEGQGGIQCGPAHLLTTLAPFSFPASRGCPAGGGKSSGTACLRQQLHPPGLLLSSGTQWGKDGGGATGKGWERPGLWV